MVKGKLKRSWTMRWLKPPLDTYRFGLHLCTAYRHKATDPQGFKWPWTEIYEINAGYFLSDDPCNHLVSQEMIAAGRGLNACDRVRLSVAVRHRGSARGLLDKYKQAILSGTLRNAILESASFGDQGTPCRSVVLVASIAEQVDHVARKARDELPFATEAAARDFFANGILGTDAAGKARRTSFHGAEIAKGFARWGMVSEKSTAPVETGARKGMAYACRRFGPKWTQARLAKLMRSNESRAETRYCLSSRNMSPHLQRRTRWAALYSSA